MLCCYLLQALLGCAVMPGDRFVCRHSPTSRGHCWSTICRHWTQLSGSPASIRCEEEVSEPSALLLTLVWSINQVYCGCLCCQVLFPLLTKLLDNISPADVGGMEETRMRGCTLLSKVNSNTQQQQETTPVHLLIYQLYTLYL